MPVPLPGRRPSPCERLAPQLPAFAAREAALAPSVADHVDRCLRCQAEVARYRRMLRTLHSLRTDTAIPPPAVLARILDDADAPVGAGMPAVAAVASVAAALGALAAVAWVRWHPVAAGPTGWRGALAQTMETMLPTSRAITKPMTTT